jgi:hypothetical protein
MNVAVKPVPPASCCLVAKSPNPSKLPDPPQFQPTAQPVAVRVAVLFHPIKSIPMAVSPEFPPTQVKVSTVLPPLSEPETVTLSVLASKTTSFQLFKLVLNGGICVYRPDLKQASHEKRGSY